MHSLTYKDIIDDKVAEWQQSLKKLEEQVESNSPDDKDDLLAKIEQIKLSVDAAMSRLHRLDEQETGINTMEIKDKILGIFNAVDESFVGFEHTSPFMI